MTTDWLYGHWGQISKFSAFIMGLLLSVAPAHAEHWWVVVKKDLAGDSVLADSETVKPAGIGRRIFWVHRFYEKPENGMASARIQYEVNCSTSSLLERSYVDYDQSRSPIASGDNSENGEWQKATPNSGGFLMVEFACSAPADRKSKFWEVSDSQDHWGLGEFLREPGALVSSESKPVNKPVVESRKQPKVAYSKYEACAMSSARRFVRSGETAPIIAAAAQNSCSDSRRDLMTELALDPQMNPKRIAIVIAKLDSFLTEKLVTEVVKLKSQNPGR